MSVKSNEHEQVYLQNRLNHFANAIEKIEIEQYSYIKMNKGM